MQINFYIMLAEAVIILFELRSLMQSSGIDYYHPATQTVVKLTEPVMKLLPFRNKNIKGFYYAGFIVAFAIKYHRPRCSSKSVWRSGARAYNPSMSTL